MSAQGHDQKIEVMLRSTGEWVTLHTWNSDDAEFDASGWLAKWAERVGRSQAPLPGPGEGFVDLTAFCAIREGADR